MNCFLPIYSPWMPYKPRTALAWATSSWAARSGPNVIVIGFQPWIAAFPRDDRVRHGQSHFIHWQVWERSGARVISERCCIANLSFSCAGWVWDLPTPLLNSNQAALTKAARDLSAVEKVENGQSPLALSIIFAEKGSNQKLRPNESLMAALVREKRRMQTGAVAIKLTIAVRSFPMLRM